MCVMYPVQKWRGKGGDLKTSQNLMTVIVLYYFQGYHFNNYIIVCI